VWNALDANATEVDVELRRSSMKAITDVVVTVDGHGMTPKRAPNAFQAYGTTWKTSRTHTEGGERILHGRNGEGRLYAFALGDRLTWESTAVVGDALVGVQIRGNADHATIWQVEETEPTRDKPGTTSSTAASPAPDYANHHDDVTHSWSVMVGQGAKRAAYVLAVDALYVHAGKARHFGPVRDHFLAGRPTDGEADHAVGVVKAVLDDLSSFLHRMDPTEVHGEYQPELLTGERMGVILLLARIATGHSCEDAGTVVGESLVGSDPFDCRIHALLSGREA